VKGKILGYNLQESAGVISGEDGNRYKFSNNSWMADKSPKVGQVVDFVIEREAATEIYVDASSFNFDKDDMIDSTKEKIEELKQSKLFTQIVQNMKNTRENGMQHKVGFTITVMLLLAYFLPVIEIPYVGNMSLWNGDFGLFVVILLLALSYLYYSGAKTLFIRIATGMILLMIFMQYNDLVSGLKDTMSFIGGRAAGEMVANSLKIGNLIIIPLTIALGVVGIFRRNKK